MSWWSRTTRPQEPQAPGALGPDRHDNLWATFVDPRTGAVVDEVPIGVADGAIYGGSVSVRPGGAQVVVGNN